MRMAFGSGDGFNMFDIKKHEVKQCSINEFNGILKALDNRKIVYETAHGKDVGPRAYLWSNISKAYLVYNEFSDKIVTRCFETDLNELYEDGYLDKMESAMRSSIICGKALKFPRVVKDKSEATVNASGIIWSNKKYNGKNVYCYEYDMHLAWLGVFMKNPLPDTTVAPKLKTIVGKNEIGFVKNGLGGYNCGDNVVFEGDYADYIFPIMHCPNPAFCNKLLTEINKLDGLPRKSRKGRFNKWLGTMQNKNPYIRVAVIAQSNKYIIDLIKKYKDKLIFSVTDSLGAVERIPELDELIGIGAGCWSLKIEGYLYTDRFNRLYLDNQGYIKNSVIRGVPKQHLIGLNITEYKQLTKKIDPTKNLYKIDEDKRRLVKND